MLNVFHLSTCSTCKRILSEVELPAEHKLVDVKSNPISAEDLAKMYALEGTYEALFNKRAQLYKQRDLKSKNLSEEDYKNLLLEHYTFLKRPVFLFQDQIFVGNAKKNLQELKSYLDD